MSLTKTMLEYHIQDEAEQEAQYNEMVLEQQYYDYIQQQKYDNEFSMLGDIEELINENAEIHNADFEELMQKISDNFKSNL